MINPIESSNYLKDTEGRRKFKSWSGHGNKFIQVILPKLTDELTEVLAKPARGRTPMYVKRLEGLDVSVIALITLSVCLDSLMEPMSKLTVANRIAKYCVQELNYQTLESASPGLIEGIQKYRKNHRAAKCIDDAAKNGEFGNVQKDLVTWPLDERHTVGLVLIEAMKRIYLVEDLEEYRGKQRAAMRIQWTLEVQEWAADVYERQLFFSPAWLPLTNPPLPYGSNGEPEVNYSYGPSFPPIEFRREGKSMKPPIYAANGMNIKAADYLGSVPYQVNTEVFSVVKELWDRGYEVGQLVSSKPRELPPYPAPDHTEEELTAWKSKASRTYLYNQQTNGLRMYTGRQMSLVESYQDHPLHFIWQSDWRGRLYPVATTLLNPQGNDLSKGLLKFHRSQSKPMGTDGYRQLLRATAEHFGIDKVSMKAREEWTEDSLDSITAVAACPIETFDWWNKADNPFQFLAACMELTAAHEWAIKNNSKPCKYPSSYIKYFDGKCSGVQHWSMLLRNEDTGKSVALTQSSEGDTPPDLYSEVLVGLVEYLSSAQPTARTSMCLNWWRQLLEDGYLDRSLVKRPTMTYVYGSTTRAWTQHIYQWCSELPSKYIEVFSSESDSENTGHSLFKACAWMSSRISAVLGKRLTAAVVGMDWIKIAVRDINKVSPEVTWVTPKGFEVHQAYLVTKDERLNIRSNSLGIRIQIVQKSSTEKPDYRKQTSGIAPNYIHSLDASHLVDTVMKMSKESSPMTVIHDSFGVLLGDSGYLLDNVRSSMHEQYTVDNLKELKGYWEKRYNITLQDVPTYGTLDTSSVLESTYAFS